MSNRASSIYSLRVRTTVPQAVLVSLTEGLAFTGNKLQDSHVRIEDGAPHAAVGFRAADDDHAIRLANEVIDHAGLQPAVRSGSVRLVTGYGIHRRSVAF
jgi:hypothetical protein